MKKICTVVGARPQFIKLAVVSRVLRKQPGFQEVLIHTGQHYDHNMSDVFFEEMDIPKPDYNLGISGGSHGQMTGQMLIELEKVFLKERPDMVLLFGDTNSTMAAALAAVKLHIPVCHVEAGNRFGTLDSPEEVNRMVTDHVSAIDLPCTESSFRFLEKEGLGSISTVVGDPMFDAFLYYTSRLDGSELREIVDFDGHPVTLPDAFYPACPGGRVRKADPHTAGGLPDLHFAGEPRQKDCHRLRRCTAGSFFRRQAMRNCAELCGLAGDHAQWLQSISKARKGRYSLQAVPARDL